MMTYKICGRRAWNDSNVRKALLVGCSLQLFQQLIGINTVIHLSSSIGSSLAILGLQVIYYSARILLMSGISNDMSQILWLNALVQATCFFASFIGICSLFLEKHLAVAGMALIDRLGRRVLCLSSYVGVLISLLIIGAGFQLSEYVLINFKDMTQFINTNLYCRSNTTATDTSAWEPTLPESPPIYNQCAKFADCNACTNDYDDFVSIPNSRS